MNEEIKVEEINVTDFVPEEDYDEISLKKLMSILEKNKESEADE